MMLCNHLILCHPLLLLPSIFHIIRVSTSHQVTKFWSFSFSISPSNEYSGLISFRIDWFDLLAIQGTLKSLQCSAFFMVPLSHPHMTIGKATALITWIFVGKVMSLFFTRLSRFVIVFLPKSKYLLISWLQSWSSVILEHREINSETVSIFPPVYLPRNDGKGCHDLSFLNVEFQASFFTLFFHPHQEAL